MTLETSDKQHESKGVINVYTPSLEAINEQIAMEAFHNFINLSPIAMDLDEAGKIALYLENKKINNIK